MGIIPIFAKLFFQSKENAHDEKEPAKSPKKISQRKRNARQSVLGKRIKARIFLQAGIKIPLDNIRKTPL